MANQTRDAPRKIGDQALSAMASLGLEELRNAVYPTSNVAQHSVEPGMYGDRSYGDVANDRMNQSDPQRSSLLAEKIRQAEVSREAREHQPHELVRE